MKKYIIYTIKRYIPFCCITIAVCMSMFLLTVNTVPTTHTVYNNGMSIYGLFGLEDYLFSGSIVFVIPVVVFSTILPFFANSYRYSMESADTFYQIGKGKKSIRFVNNLTLLGVFLASFTAAYFFALMVIFFKQLPNFGKAPEALIDEASGAQYGVKYFLVYNFGFYVVIYLLFVLIGICQFFISYFLVTRANNFINSLIMLVLGHVVLTALFMTPFWYAEIVKDVLGRYEPSIVNVNFMPVSRTGTVISPIMWTILVFDGLITSGHSQILDVFSNFSTNDTMSLILAIVSLLEFFGATAIGVIFFLKEPESSGEFAGKAPGRDRLQMIIFHLGFGVISLWSGVGSGLVSGVALSFLSISLVISDLLFTGAIYYVFSGLIRRNFKLDRANLITMGAVMGANLTLAIIMASLAQNAINSAY